MELWEEFNRENYENAIIDNRIRKAIGKHCSVNTDIILYGIGYGAEYGCGTEYKGITSVSRDDVSQWLSSTRISIYRPILGELSRILKSENRFKKIRELLDKPTVRFVIPQVKYMHPYKYTWELIRETDSNFAEDLLEKMKKRSISSEDAEFIGLSWYEGSTIVSFDYGIYRVSSMLSEKHSISFHDPLKKLPHEFTSTWNEHDLERTNYF